MASGVYTARKKDGTVYYRANIHYHAKHISLGSYATQAQGAEVYAKARALLADPSATLPPVPTMNLSMVTRLICAMQMCAISIRITV